MVLLVEALTGLCLNSLTILSFCKTPELRTPTHLLVLSLALADSGISLNALVAATSSLLRYQPPLPQSLSSGAQPELGVGQPGQRHSSHL
ncbi:RPE-retinal G protein-coupled receptor isoform X2 [Prionailurus iriomotensis]